jgi:S-adenosylmethionine decarboxylase
VKPLAQARNGLDDTEPILKRKHFFLASLSSCSIIQAHFAQVRRDFGEQMVSISGGERGSIALHSLGRHLLLELHDCSSEILNNLETVKGALVEAAKRAEATIIDVLFHEFNPFGISGVVVIAESHLTIHTWPEYRYAAVDIFSCGDTLKPSEAAAYLVEQFKASHASCVEVKRGVFPGSAAPPNKTEKEGAASNGSAEQLQVVF